MSDLGKEQLAAIVQEFRDRTLPKAAWTHRAHLIVAVWTCYHTDPAESLAMMRRQIIVYNEAVGTVNSDSGGYHETITRFWLHITRFFLARGKFETVEDACTAFLHSQWATRRLPLRYYSRQLLFSVTARHHWVEPDLEPLPSLDE